MAKSSKLKVMISSRCNDHFDGVALSGIRMSLKSRLEALEVFGRTVLEVWINEETPPQGGTWDSWDVCIQAVKGCDILIALSNGNAGWAAQGGDLGICHAELMTGLSASPAKVRLIALGDIALDSSDQGKRNERFQSYVKSQNLFRGGTVSDRASLENRVEEAVRDAMVALAQAGVRESNKDKFNAGQALEWSRLDFRRRQTEMVKVLREAILLRKGSKDESGHLFARLAGELVSLVPHAIPDGLGVPSARELVGQPFLLDHELAAEIKSAGPVHVIACHKTATESQATKMLGFPDAVVVKSPFGVYVADRIQKVQFAFLVNCRDEDSTRHNLQRYFEWLEQTEEDKQLLARAKSRAKIVKAIAKEANSA